MTQGNMRNGSSWRDIHGAIGGIVLFAALALWDHSRGFELWRNYALSGVLIASIIAYWIHATDVRLPNYIQWIIILALLTHYGGGSLGSPDPYRMGLLGTHGINGAYHHFEWWDHLTHGAGIFATAIGFAYLLEVYLARRRLPWHPAAIWTVTVLASLTAGVGVELYEYLGKTIFQTIDQGGYANTMLDIHYNLLGATLGATLAVTLNRRHFRQRIQQQFGINPDEATPQSPKWWMQIPPGMTGFLVFITLPALVALGMAIRFLFIEVPANDLPLYDAALRTLTRTSLVAAITGPLAGWLHARILAISRNSPTNSTRGNQRPPAPDEVEQT